MRLRTEVKRQEIVRIAAQLFEELGYERTSMSEISARVGGSKATLYGYFASKEDLLRAVLDHVTEGRWIRQEIANGRHPMPGQVRFRDAPGQ